MPKNKDGYFRSTFVIGKKSDGTPERITVRGKTKKELDEKLAEAKRLYARGFGAGNLTVFEWSERWLKVCKANASPTQKAHYRVKLEKDILPFIGTMPIKDVRTSHLQELLNNYAGGKVGTISKIRIAIKQLFEDAEIEGVIERNPAIRLELPALVELSRRPLTASERSVVYEVAKTHPRGAYVLTMLFCGLRRGECIALTVGDIDLDHRRISVNKSLSLRRNVGEEKSTKSKAGIREVPIPDILLPVLAKQCSGKEETAILFSKSDGAYATKQTCTWWWKSFLRQCHIKAGAKVYRNKILTETSPFDDNITPHYLRHTYATDLYVAGVDEKAQKSFLGHASNDITDIYRKMSETAFVRALDMMNEYHSSLKLND